MRSKLVHRFTAVILGTFILVHLGTHLFALGGPEVHTAALRAVQGPYRHPLGETLLILAIMVQIVTGWKRLRAKRRLKWARAQVISGIYLMVFMVLHTGAALFTRHVYGLETDFQWPAGSLHFNPIRYGFAVYYFCAVLAVFVHLAAGLRFGWPGAPRLLLAAVPVTGAALAALIVATFWGAFYAIEIGDGMTEYYRDYFGLFGIVPWR